MQRALEVAGDAPRGHGSDMCTLLLAVDVWDGARLVVAANRDEVLDRPASGPQLWERGGRRFFAPRDEVGQAPRQPLRQT